MYKISFSSRFKKSYKLCVKRGLDPEIMARAIKSLAETATVPKEFKPHQLTGDYKDCMECHLQPDWLLVWKKNQDVMEVLMVTTGTHSDIFGKKRR